MLYNCFVYISTNEYRTTLYIGVTNNIQKRLSQHLFDSQNAKQSFAGKYNCNYLVYYEGFQYPKEAIGREKNLKNGVEKRRTNLFLSLILNGKL